jgi:hypothetical protein
VRSSDVIGYSWVVLVIQRNILYRKKEDADYIRRLQSDDVPSKLPPGCCELSNVVFFETLCCLGILKSKIQKDVAKVDFDQCKYMDRKTRVHVPASSQSTPIAFVYTTSMPWLSASENPRLHEYPCSLGNQSMSFHDFFCRKNIIRGSLRGTCSSGIRRRLPIETCYPIKINLIYLRQVLEYD